MVRPACGCTGAHYRHRFVGGRVARITEPRAQAARRNVAEPAIAWSRRRLPQMIVDHSGNLFQFRWSGEKAQSAQERDRSPAFTLG